MRKFGVEKRQVPRLPRSCEARAVPNLTFGTCSTMFIGRVTFFRREVGFLSYVPRDSDN